MAGSPHLVVDLARENLLTGFTGISDKQRGVGYVYVDRIAARVFFFRFRDKWMKLHSKEFWDIWEKLLIESICYEILRTAVHELVHILEPRASEEDCWKAEAIASAAVMEAHYPPD